MKYYLTLYMLVLVTGQTVFAQQANEPAAKPYKPASVQLFNEIAHMDSVMFDAFNAHDLEKLKSTFSDSLEFYHDRGGLSNFSQTMEAFKTLFERNASTGLRRSLVPGSLEVYPIKDFGALEVCLHQFCHKENGRDDCGVFKNIMLWQKKDGRWKVTRVISYDH